MEPSFAPLAPGTVLQGTFKVGERIGSGSMGDIYLATHTRLAGQYAIKVLHIEASLVEHAFERFRREAEITSALRNPHIVQIIDFNQTPDGRPYMVMEHLSGRDLASRLKTEAPLPLGRAATIVEQVAWALGAAHGIGVTHRDLKPANIFCVQTPGADREFVKVFDFGISKIKNAAKLTDSTSLLGTPQYMSPEQARGRVDEIDPMTDQFALAAILYEMVVGRPAFPGDNVPVVLHAVVTAEPAPLPAGLQALEPAIRKALSKNKADRFPTITEFAQAVQAAARL